MKGSVSDELVTLSRDTDQMAIMRLCSLNTSPVSEVLTLLLHWRYHAAGFFRKHPVLTVPPGGDVML